MAERVAMPAVTLIVARSEPDHVIGRDSAIPWRLRTDLQLFKRATLGHALVMGRRTLDSIGRPLPGRLSVVLSRTPGAEAEGVRWAGSPESALLAADIHAFLNGQDQVFVAGGGEVYRLLAPAASRVRLTQVHAPVEGDAVFDMALPEAEWRVARREAYPAGEADEHPFTISILERRTPAPRLRSADELLAAAAPGERAALEAVLARSDPA